MATQGRYLASYDTQFRLRRIQGGAGVLESLLDGSGNLVIRWTSAPTVSYSTMAVGLNTPFAGILAAVGDQTITKRILPTASGFLRGLADGTFQFEALPAAVVPDPLTLTTLNASTGNITDLTTTGTVIFDNLPTDTATQALGLNAAGELVIPAAGAGSIGATSIAKYYETATFETTGATPNNAKTNGSFLQIGNKMFDPDTIVSVTDQMTLRIEQAGDYAVEWGCGAGPISSLPSANATIYHMSVGLLKNGALVSFGDQSDMNVARRNSATFTGAYMDTFAVGDTVKLRLDTDTPVGEPTRVRNANVRFYKVG